MVQLLAWDDTTKLIDAFIVFRPNGGTDIRNDLGYGFELDCGYQTEICRYVWEKYAKRLVEEKLQKRVKQRIVSLVWLAVQDVAVKNKNPSYREYACIALAGMASVNRSTWSRVYSEHWMKLKEMIEELDFVSLAKIEYLSPKKI
ncbi:hypothetical protein FAI37_15685 [Enterobacter bugandensis]|nr:hypothetical protein FAI37_15685 [Enterobacter bugandensis]